MVPRIPRAPGRYRTGARPLALLFPGQGSQSVGMFRDLACRFPRMQAALALWNEAAGPGGGRLSDRIYPPSCFREDDRGRQHEALRDTRFAQPAIGAVSLGLLHILEDFGVRADTGGRTQLRRVNRTVCGRTNRPSDAGDALVAAWGPDGRLCGQRRPGSHARGVCADRTGGRFDPGARAGRRDRQQERPPTVCAFRTDRRDRAGRQRIPAASTSIRARWRCRRRSTAGSWPEPGRGSGKVWLRWT